MTPIGKGSRFLVLGGTLRGQTITVGEGPDAETLWRCATDGGEHTHLRGDDLASSAFKRLADAPAEVDPLFEEIECSGAEFGPGYDDTIVGAGGIVDEIRNVLGGIEEGETDADWFASHRAAFVEIARLCLLGIRRIDRRGTP